MPHKSTVCRLLLLPPSLPPSLSLSPPLLFLSLPFFLYESKLSFGPTLLANCSVYTSGMQIDNPTYLLNRGLHANCGV